MLTFQLKEKSQENFIIIMVTQVVKGYFRLAVCATFVAAMSGLPSLQGPEGPLPIPRKGSNGPDQYFQYINVPAHKTLEKGYQRGNPKHNREENLSQKDPIFKAKVQE